MMSTCREFFYMFTDIHGLGSVVDFPTTRLKMLTVRKDAILLDSGVICSKTRIPRMVHSRSHFLAVGQFGSTVADWFVVWVNVIGRNC